MELNTSFPLTLFAPLFLPQYHALRDVALQIYPGALAPRAPPPPTRGHNQLNPAASSRLLEEMTSLFRRVPEDLLSVDGNELVSGLQSTLL